MPWAAIDHPTPCYHSLIMSHTASASSSRFESIFNSALDAYKIRTKQDLPSHPLLPALQSCDSADAIITVLREQIPAFSQSQSSDDRLSTWLVPTVNVLYAFSDALGEGVGLVNTTAFLPLGTSALMSVPFPRYSRPRKPSLQESAFYSWSVSSMIHSLESF